MIKSWNSKFKVNSALYNLNDQGAKAIYNFIKQSIICQNYTQILEIQELKDHTDLSNDLGNLCQRVISMIYKNCDGKVPNECQYYSDEDKIFIEEFQNLYSKVRVEINNQSFHQALKLIWHVISSANKFVDEQAPWKLKNTNLSRMNDVLWILAESLRTISILIQPFMPSSADKILNQLSVLDNERTFEFLKPNVCIRSNLIENPNPVFPRITD